MSHSFSGECQTLLRLDYIRASGTWRGYRRSGKDYGLYRSTFVVMGAPVLLYNHPHILVLFDREPTGSSVG